MNCKKFSDAMSEVDNKYVDEAISYKAPKKNKWLKWVALAACFALVLAVGIPQLANLIRPRGGPGQDDPLRPENVMEFNGAYYRVIDMSNTELLDDYNLPHEIVTDMVGKELGNGLDEGGNKTPETLYQYAPYAGISTNEQERSQRAVYIASENEEYAFALFCCFTHFDTNTYQEPSEMFVVYGVDSVEDIRIVEIEGKEVSDFAEIKSLFENIYNAAALGNDDYQKAVLDNMTEAEQAELMSSIVEIKLITNDGLVINNMSYFPTTGYISWNLNYYKLSDPISLK